MTVQHLNAQKLTAKKNRRFDWTVQLLKHIQHYFSQERKLDSTDLMLEICQSCLETEWFKSYNNKSDIPRKSRGKFLSNIGKWKARLTSLIPSTVVMMQQTVHERLAWIGHQQYALYFITIRQKRTLACMGNNHCKWRSTNAIHQWYLKGWNQTYRESN